jgi:hypothetical protein
MKTALILLFLILPTLSFSQMVNNVPLKDIDAEYVEFSVGGRGFMQAALYIYLDYGQKVIKRPESQIIKDSDGNDLKFNSDIDCLNFMVKNGYELVSKNEKVSSGNSYSSYLMRKLSKNKSENKIE